MGIVFCGRQSPGGHNVIWGLLDALKIHNPDSVLLGFLGKAFCLSPQYADVPFRPSTSCLLGALALMYFHAYNEYPL